MKVSDAIAQLGIDPTAVPGELCIVQFVKKGTKKVARHYRFSEVADREISVDLYLATGTFAPGKITDYEGRSADNVVSVLWLVLDCDFKDYLGIAKEQLYEWTDGDLMTTARALAGDLRELLEAIGVAVHRIDYTGYGICAYIYLNGHTTADVPEIAALNAGLVDQVNSMWGSTLADPGVHDAGPRVTRLVPGPNTKGPTPRAAETIYRAEGHIALSDLSKVIQKRTRTTVARAIPRTGSDIPAATVHALIDAIAPHWQEGSRHGLALAVAGIFAKAGVPEAQAATIVEHVATSTGDSELPDRLKAVETSYARARMGLETRGLYGLRDWLPIETVEWIDRTLDEVRPRSAELTFTATERVVDDNTPLEDMPVLPLPEIVKQGWIGDYMALMAPTTEASESYHLGVGLTIAAAMIGRNVFVSYGSDVYANLYTLLVGVSGKSRKDTAIKRGTRLLTTQTTSGTTQRRSGVQIATDVASAQGLIKSLSETQNVLLYLTEFSRLIQTSRNKGTQTILPVLMEAFDTPTVLSHSSISNPYKAEYPYLSIVSATQPRILEGLMSDDDVHSGFINRWLIIPGKSNAPKPWPVSVDRQTAALLFERLHDAVHQAYPTNYQMPLADDARSFWESWYIDEWHRRQTPDEEAMRARYATLVVKIALIYAVLNGDQLITQDHLEKGIAVIEWMWAHVIRMVPSWGSTTHGRLEAKFLQTLEERGPMKRRDLTRSCSNRRKWSSMDMKQVLEALMSNGVIHIDSTGMVGLRND